MSRINFGPWADGTKPFVRQAITVEPSAMFSTSLILESVEERYKEGVRKSEKITQRNK